MRRLATKEEVAEYSGRSIEISAATDSSEV